MKLFFVYLTMTILACNSKSDITQNHQSRDEAWLASTVESMKSDFEAAKNDIEKDEVKEKYKSIVGVYVKDRGYIFDSIEVRVERIETITSDLIKAEFRSENIEFTFLLDMEDNKKKNDSLYRYIKSLIPGSEIKSSFFILSVEINDPDRNYTKPVVFEVIPIPLTARQSANESKSKKPK